ncbi:carboxypeptidase-like regulatory domain-containing protein, partial [Bacteroidota bacterium]
KRIGFLIFTFCVCHIGILKSQNLTQVVKGKILDKESQISLPGANVVILGTNPVIGTVSDPEGNFRLENVPIGRYNIQISFIGYESVTIPEILVSSGKEVVLNISLKESINQLDEVVVKAHVRKDKALNSMATISARSFTVEETRRYAGGIDDPARMVSAFAGVTTGNLQDNAIIIRGNSPKGVAWRIEGVDVPNPNHFSGGNVAGGGAVNVISGQLLSNSDFFTGAFPAEYGNALAGVFDIKLRTGNYEKREYAFQAGLLGIDFAAEGPFVKGYNASYVFNYRYSTFGLMKDLGLLPSDQIPEYQDLCFKLNIPTSKAGIFSVWGIGAVDLNHEPTDYDSTLWNSDWDRVTYDWNVKMGAIGLSHKYIIGKKTYINTNVVGSGNNNSMDQKRLDNDLILQPNWYFIDQSNKITIGSCINHKFSARHTNRTGVNYNLLYYNLDLNGTVSDDWPESYRNFVKEDGNSRHVQFYTQSKYNITSNFSVNMGLHSEYFAFNNNFTIDPRFGLNWEFLPTNTISFGYGKHSQMEELKIYFINYEQNGTLYTPNKDLDLSHAHHFVLGYDKLITQNLRLKIEPYYQYLYNIPGIEDSSYSMINFKQDWGFRESLENNCVGKNIGVDITLERFLNNNYYYLITASIFDSKYKGDDGIWRNTRYDKEFVANILFGKEFFIGNNNNNVLGINGRLNTVGGERRAPLLMQKSIEAKTEIYDNTRVFEDKEKIRNFLDLTITYRINKKNHSSIWAMQVK